MAMRLWRIVEEELKRCENVNDPTFLRAMGEVHERLRVQHEQMMQLANTYSTLVDRFNDVVGAAGRLKDVIDKAGLSEKLRELDGDPQEVGSTHELTRNRKN